MVGLGNPGPEYRYTRHNVGFQVVDSLAAGLHIGLRRPWFQRYRLGKGSWGRHPIVLAQPLTFMNRSGQAIRPILRRCSASMEDLLVVCDSLDLPVGRCRLRLEGSSGGHKGLESIRRETGTTRFRRLLVGIGRPASAAEVVAYVLGEPERDEAARLVRAVQRAVEAILLLPEEGPQKVMNVLNQRGS